MSEDLPSPMGSWEESKLYVLKPFEKRGETDQGIGLLTLYSLGSVAKGFRSESVWRPLSGFWSDSRQVSIGCSIQSSRFCGRSRPLAWLPLGLVLFQSSEPAAFFAIALCSMWPTVLNTMAGVRSIPQDYWNVAKVLRLSKTKTFLKILLPATLPHIFTGYRLSLGIAWLVIVPAKC